MRFQKQSQSLTPMVKESSDQVWCLAIFHATRRIFIKIPRQLSQWSLTCRMKK